MRVYLDNCCYSRPFDPQSSTKIQLETKAKMDIQRLIKEGKVEFCSSFISLYECGRNTNAEASSIVTDFISKNSTVYLTRSYSGQIQEIADGIMKTGVKFFDAFHVAAAVLAKADYFISVDKRLLKYKSDEIKLISPINFFYIDEINGEEVIW